MSKEDKNVYYVYGCFVNGVIRYIGKGKGDRWKHCTSGSSTCRELNKDLFDGKNMEVKLLYEGLSEEYALQIEKLEIMKTPFLYNTVHNPKISSVFTDTIPIPCKLLANSSIVSSRTGQDVPITFTDKIIYSFLRFYITSNNEPCTMSQAEIADVLGLEKKSVGKSIRKLQDHNFIYGTKQAFSEKGVERWIYTGINEFLQFVK